MYLCLDIIVYHVFPFIKDRNTKYNIICLKKYNTDYYFGLIKSIFKVKIDNNIITKITVSTDYLIQPGLLKNKRLNKLTVYKGERKQGNLYLDYKEVNILRLVKLYSEECHINDLIYVFLYNIITNEYSKTNILRVSDHNAYAFNIFTTLHTLSLECPISDDGTEYEEYIIDKFISSNINLKRIFIYEPYDVRSFENYNIDELAVIEFPFNIPKLKKLTIYHAHEIEYFIEYMKKYKYRNELELILSDDFIPHIEALKSLGFKSINITKEYTVNLSNY